MSRSLLHSQTWPTPKSRDVGSYGSVELYAEALRMAQREGVITPALLGSKDNGLGARLRGLHIVKSPTKTIAEDLLRELKAYGWIRPSTNEPPSLMLTDAGKKITETLKSDPRGFRRKLLVKMHEWFQIPGWFVTRLHAINPKHNGEVVLPSPCKDWTPEARNWEDVKWTDELEIQVTRSYDQTKALLPHGFPVMLDTWIGQIKREWEEISNARRRRVSRPKIEPGEKVKTYAPRGRLSRSMRAAAVELLFANKRPLDGREDFETAKHPIPPRSFQSWCPLLESLELIFYTDSHPSVTGRVIFPCSAFRGPTCDSRFEEISGVRDPEGRTLWLHSPSWSTETSLQFIETLHSVYIGTKSRTKTLYVSLLDVRDEVCRRLRLSSFTFDEFLGETIRYSLNSPGDRAFAISVESDVRPNLQGGHGVFRRPVYLQNVPHSLIAISFAT